MTQRDTLTSIHEPFGDAFYYGPERLGMRYENDEKGRLESGFSKSTYATIFDRIAADGADVITFPSVFTLFSYWPHRSENCSAMTW